MVIAAATHRKQLARAVGTRRQQLAWAAAPRPRCRLDRDQNQNSESWTSKFHPANHLPQLPSAAIHSPSSMDTAPMKEMLAQLMELPGASELMQSRLTSTKAADEPHVVDLCDQDDIPLAHRMKNSPNSSQTPTKRKASDAHPPAPSVSHHTRAYFELASFPHQGSSHVCGLRRILSIELHR